jgi:hypothetical protein
MKSSIVIWTVVACMVSGASRADLGLLSDQLQNSVMSELIGHWQIADSSLNQQGQWQAGVGASWHFYPILNGHAIQDDWIAPALDQPEPENGRQYGSNIRIFNPKENQWEMAWASVKGQKIDTFTAEERDGTIIMTGQFNGQNSRITFYNVSKQSFDWKLEFEQADKSWSEVYRIKGERVTTTP